MSNPEYVLVTGGSSGIGAAIAQQCHADGYQVIIMSRSVPQSAPFAEHIAVDLSDRQATAACLKDLAQRRSITRLVNNMGGSLELSLENTRVADIDDLANVNLKVALQVTQAVLPAMRAAGMGRIVNISSRSALGKRDRTAYSAMKAALNGMSRTWALELAPHITVNVVAPGPIETEMYRRLNTRTPEQTSAFLKTIPAARMGKPEEIAGAVSYFLDRRSAFTTGQTLYVCGGLSIASY